MIEWIFLTGVVAVNRDGKAEPYHIKNRSDGKRVYIGNQNVYLSPGFYEYQITYITTRQLGFFDDFDELYWNVTGTDWAFRIERASARVTLPEEVTDFQLTGNPGDSYCYCDCDHQAAIGRNHHENNLLWCFYHGTITHAVRRLARFQAPWEERQNPGCG